MASRRVRRSSRPRAAGAARVALALTLGGSLLAGCGSRTAPGGVTGGGATPLARPEPVSRLQAQLAAMTPAAALPPSDGQRQLSALIDAYWQRAASQRLYVHVDKPLYQPGESIWFRVWELHTSSLTSGAGQAHGLLAELINPKGAALYSKRLDAANPTNDFELPADLEGGEYTLRVTSDLGGQHERSLIVASYQAPQIKKTLEFLRKAYGASDNVAAAVALARNTGEPLASKRATALVAIDEVEVARLPFTTDPAGKATVRFTLPDAIARGDGLLTILVEDGGVTESIQKRIPIVQKELDLAFYPEGGDLVAGLPGRVYFQARNLLGKAADIEGRIVDDAGAEVASLRSFDRGLGRFDLVPAAGKHYFAEITRPAGIAQKVPLPVVQDSGCSLQAVDDFEGARPELRVAIWCSSERDVVATFNLREKQLGELAVAVTPGLPTLVALPMPAGAQGAVRATLFDDAMSPLAERLVYRGRGADLKLSISPDKPRYSPRDPVALAISARDLAGKPVVADLSLAVVDDTVLSFADDKSAGLLARLYLESEMPGQTIEEPNFYFSNDAKAPAALDLVLGTQGWRRFDWAPALAPPMEVVPTSASNRDFEDDLMLAEAAAAPVAKPRGALAPPAPPPVARQDKGKAAGPMRDAKKEKKAEADRKDDAPRAERRAKPNRGGIAAQGGAVWAGARGIAADEAWDGDMMEEQAVAPVREFPAPSYEGQRDAVRTDFRETIYWAPSVKTDRNGQATVRFYLSDGVTSFRAVAEGASAGGLPGRGEAMFQSKLPVSLQVTMPLEVSAGDTVRLPVTLANETEHAYRVAVSTSFGKAFRVKGGIPATVELAAGKRASFFAELAVVGDGKLADDGVARVAIATAGLSDEVARTIRVVPLGFPAEVSLAGTLAARSADGKASRARHEVTLAGALPGSIEASVLLYPSPLATLVQGTEAIIREPYGCFEQASSANYPNIMVLSYLQENEAAEPELVQRTQAVLDKGYGMLAGYESPQKGYEWFGGDPGHEALTAYGVMEFADMSKVFDVDRGMVERTRAWLRGRRDGKGGYLRNDRALDSFGSASPEVTNGYVTWALTETAADAAGAKALGKELADELALQRKVGASTDDAYLLALAANTLANVEPAAPGTEQVLARLGKAQDADGAWSHADHSITRSGGEALTIETTALATMALIQSGHAQEPPVRNAIAWLDAHRSGFGNFSSTQATVLALRALAEYTRASRVTTADGTVTLRINGKAAGSAHFEKGQRDSIALGDAAGLLRVGKNVIELELDSGVSLPYSIALVYRSAKPASSPASPVSIATTLAKDKIAMGETVRLKVALANTTDDGIPMTMARVGLPGGLTFQTWQLKELREKGIIDFYETREREVILYFRSLGPKAQKAIDLDLMARVPGSYVGPASRGYLYYTDEHKTWVDPLRVTVTE